MVKVVLARCRQERLSGVISICFFPHFISFSSQPDIIQSLCPGWVVTNKSGKLREIMLLFQGTTSRKQHRLTSWLDSILNYLEFTYIFRWLTNLSDFVLAFVLLIASVKGQNKIKWLDEKATHLPPDSQNDIQYVSVCRNDRWVFPDLHKIRHNCKKYIQLAVQRQVRLPFMLHPCSNKQTSSFQLQFSIFDFKQIWTGDFLCNL